MPLFCNKTALCKKQNKKHLCYSLFSLKRQCHKIFFMNRTHLGPWYAEKFVFAKIFEFEVRKIRLGAVWYCAESKFFDKLALQNVKKKIYSAKDFYSAKDILLCQGYFTLSRIFYSVKDILLGPGYFTLLRIFYSFKDILLCQGYFILLRIFYSAKDILLCRGYFTLPRIFYSSKNILFF